MKAIYFTWVYLGGGGGGVLMQPVNNSSYTTDYDVCDLKMHDRLLRND